MLQICSKLIKMGSLELCLGRVPMSADFIDPHFTETSHSAEIVTETVSETETRIIT